MTKITYQELHNLCQQMQDEGITPSVALLRAKCLGPLPLPIAIKVIKDFGSGLAPRKEIIDKKKTLTDSERLALLEPKVITLEQKVAALESQLSALVKNADSVG